MMAPFSLRHVQSIKRNDPYTHFSQQPHNKLTWLVIFYYFLQKEMKTKQKNNKILSATSAWIISRVLIGEDDPLYNERNICTIILYKGKLC